VRLMELVLCMLLIYLIIDKR